MQHQHGKATLASRQVITAIRSAALAGSAIIRFFSGKSLVFVSVMAEMRFRLGCFMLAIRRNARPGKLERDYRQQ